MVKSKSKSQGVEYRLKMADYYPMSAKAKQRLSLLKKGVKRTEQEKQNIKLGQQRSPKYQRNLEKWRLLRELKPQAKDAKRRELETRRLQRIALQIAYNESKVGYHTREGIEKIREANRGKTPWNKGVEAWNHNKQWSSDVKENISRGMVVYWIQKKGKQQQQGTRQR